MSGSPAARVRATTFGLALVIGLPSLATAYQVRFEAGQACTFALLVDVVGGDNRQVKEFKEKNGIVRILSAGVGSQLTFTNLANDTTHSLRANGSVTNTTINPDGSFTNTLTGHNVLFLYPTDVPAGPTTTLYAGRVIYTSDQQSNFTLQGTHGKSTDICAALSS